MLSWHSSPTALLVMYDVARECIITGDVLGLDYAYFSDV
jgi:hypothetical protein